MAARRGKSQAKRNQSNGLPGWAWLVIGIVLTLLAVLLVPRYLKSEGGDGFFRPKPNPDALPAHATVYDIVYAPLKTKLLLDAEKRGLPVVTGIGMLLHQAVPAFEAWTGTRPAVDAALETLVLEKLA